MIQEAEVTTMIEAQHSMSLAIQQMMDKNENDDENVALNHLQASLDETMGELLEKLTKGPNNIGIKRGKKKRKTLVVWFTGQQTPVYGENMKSLMIAMGFLSW